MTTKVAAAGESFVLLSFPSKFLPRKRSPPGSCGIDSQNAGGEVDLNRAQGNLSRCVDGLPRCFSQEERLPVTGRVISSHPPIVCSGLDRAASPKIMPFMGQLVTKCNANNPSITSPRDSSIAFPELRK